MSRINSMDQLEKSWETWTGSWRKMEKGKIQNQLNMSQSSD